VLLARRYDLRRRLGEGGHGVVYHAFDHDLRRDVALKVLRGDVLESRDRLKREFRVLQDIAHPNLVTLGELGEHDGAPFFTMELIDGVGFLSWVGCGPEPDSPIDVARVRDAFGQLFDGLSALHAARLVHRDVKPRNALVRGDGRVVLLDFGLVVANAAPPARVADGTPAYMAPEQLAGLAVGPEADCYAVGVMLYQALTGRLPFDGRADRFHRMRARPEPPDRTIAPDLVDLCTALLSPEPKARATVREALAVLGRDPTRVLSIPPSATDGVARTPFVGRHVELNRLAAQLAAVRGGAARGVVVRGESGIGKTSLVGRFVDTGAAHALVLWSRCYERETVPFKAIDGVIDGLARAIDGTATAGALPADQAGAIAAMFPALVRALGGQAPRSHLSSRELRARAFAGIRALLDALARTRSVVIVIDDLQWTDLDSLALLTHVLDGPDPPPLLFVGCVRDDAAAAARAGAIASLPIALDQIVLGPLDGSAAIGLARQILGGAGADPAAIARDAGGHPLFTITLARHLVEAGRGAAHQTLGEVIDGRVRRLAPPARALVEVVCLAHEPLSMAAARAAAGISEESAVAATRAALLLRTGGPGEGDTIEPYHDRVRAAVLASIAADSRVRIHRAIARAMEATGGAHPEVLALHWAHAGDPQAAVRYAREAADRAATVLAFDRAATLYRWVLELDPTPRDRGDVLARLADALANAGRGAHAAAAYLEAARLGSGDQLVLRRRAMQQLFLGGHVARGVQLLDELAAELGIANPRGPRATFLALVARRVRIATSRVSTRGTPTARDRARIDFCFDAASGLGLIDEVRGAYFQAMNLHQSMIAGDPGRIARAVMTDTVFHAAAGPSARLERQLARCDELGLRLGQHGWPLLARGISATLLGQWRTAADKLAECAHVLGAAPGGVVDDGLAFALVLDNTRTLLCGPMLYLGRLRELRAFTATNLRDAVERNDVAAATHFRTGTQTLLWLTGGEVELAARHADDGVAPWAGFAGHLPALLDLQARVAIDLYRGDARSSAGRVVASWPAFRHSRLLRVQYVRITLLDLRGRSAIAAAASADDAGERRRMLAAAERAAARLARERAAWARPLATAIRAGVAAVRGDAGGAIRHLASAIAGFEATDMRLHAEVCRLAVARALGADGGDALRFAAYRWMASEAVVAPERLIGVIAPGLTACSAS
jgi:hypothetical protein